MEASEQAVATIGLVGIGNLGIAIARNLLDRGHEVVGYRRGGMDDFIEAGGTRASSPREVAASSDIVLTCLPSGDALADVVGGASGLVAGLRRGQAVFELSTVPVRAKEAQRDAAAAAGAHMLDCTVSGNPNFVAARTAVVFASGDADIFGEHERLLRQITDNVTYVGAFGAGTALKLITAMLTPVHTMAAAEAFSLATRAGIDRQVVFDSIKGTPASSHMFETRGKAMVTGDHSRAVGLDAYMKNLEMAAELADSLGGEYPLFRSLHDVYRAAVAAGYGDVDQSVIFDYLMRRET